MGATVVAAIDAAPHFSLVGAVDPAHAGRRLGEFVPGVDEGTAGVTIVASLDELASAAPEALVDFTRPGPALTAFRWCLAHEVHIVSGTTGIGRAEIEELQGEFSRDGASHGVIAANFAISAVLLVRLAEIAAAHFDGVEIIELHHDNKRDAPSGTALETARRIAAARAAAGREPRADPTTEAVVAGARGGVGPGEIHLHSVRLPGLVAHEEVIFGAAGQSLTLRQDSYDRSSFMPGVLAALARIEELPGLTIGLDAVLGL
jgi:4-hydroxy-tetrahydrodipicolinate reductase